MDHKQDEPDFIDDWLVSGDLEDMETCQGKSRPEPCWKEWLSVLAFLMIFWGAIYSLVF